MIIAWPKIALLEIGGSHTETLYSQLLFLQKGGYDCTLIYDSRSKAEWTDFAALAWLKEIPSIPEKGVEHIIALHRLRNFLVEEGFEKIIFNTATGSNVRDLLLLRFATKPEFFGVLHNVRKLRESISQKIISRRVKHYFVLNDFLLSQIPASAKKKKSFSAFYPVFFQEIKNEEAPEPIKDACYICIPGSVELKRRDYFTLLRALAALPPQPRLRFILGNAATPDGALIRQEIQRLGLEQNFLLADGFMPFDELHSWLRRCDAVMPLIHSNTQEMREYHTHRTSGNFNLAFAYHKPLLLENSFAAYEDFRGHAIFYTPESLAEVLRQLPELLKSAQHIYSAPKWSLDYQAEHYLHFLRS